jgi:regulator of sigma D
VFFIKQNNMNLKHSQLVDNWIKERRSLLQRLTNMAQLTEEVGEVARIIARRYGEQSERKR